MVLFCCNGSWRSMFHMWLSGERVPASKVLPFCVTVTLSFVNSVSQPASQNWFTDSSDVARFGRTWASVADGGRLGWSSRVAVWLEIIDWLSGRLTTMLDDATRLLVHGASSLM